MIQIQDIKKTYEAGEMKIQALKGVSLNFRKSEFVSILGQSGCGKTTFLNILGGLDNYDSGDLVINNISTKTYKDSDWDSYRSRYVGFVFQSYNLIMHLSVLENVELALSIAGISKEERRRKALTALSEVGLEDQIAKKPNQLSGGQMQRVAIARAIVNNPEIILADEPTGALDSKTSVQILNILKKLSKTKLVVMVTHNQELAENYSSRIIKMIDGNIISDSKPFEEPKQKKKDKPAEKTKIKKPAMNFFTALSLSFRNLLTKKTRTFLTAFAGSMGIIGIALILALSSGFQAYIKKTEQETMSSYPIQIEQTFINYMARMEMLQNNQPNPPQLEEGEIGVNPYVENFLNIQGSSLHINDLASFKTYLEENIDNSKISAVQYSYNVKLNVYNTDLENQIMRFNPLQLGAKAKAIPSLSSLFNSLQIWQELLDNQNLLQSQFELVGENSVWPQAQDEIIVVLDEKGRINDFALYSLGLRDISTLDDYLDYIYGLTEAPPTNSESVFLPEDFIGLEYKLFAESDFFKFNNATEIYEDVRKIDPADFEEHMQSISDNALKIKVVGVIKPKPDVSISIGSIGYTKELTQYLIELNNASQVVDFQMQNPTINIFTNAEFTEVESLAENLSKLGVADLNKPTQIKIYPSGFESKDYIVNFIEEYNQTQNSSGKIHYTDFIGILVSSISVIINAITYVLIAFVSISLFVSSIMIGIITYVSVLERTKEIGILRSVGARKKDVSRVFNAETLIVGFISGAFGILVTYLISIPANIILYNVMGISNIVSLNIFHAALLIVVSMSLTFVSGLIPSSLAAKKDPVKALRED